MVTDLSEAAQPTFDELMASEGLASYSDREALNRIGMLIDHSSDLESEAGTTRALEWCDAFEKRKLSGPIQATLDYFRANAWGNRAKLRNKDEKLNWTWEQPEIARELLFFRKALNNPSFDQLHLIRKCQILTNIANQLDGVGRFVEALEYFTRALELMPEFWEAQGNRGYAEIMYAKSLHDHGHAGAMLLSSHDDLTAALASAAAHPEISNPGAAAFFADKKAEVEIGLNVKKARKLIKLDGFGLGETQEEQAYRSWALRHRLFLNSLNDLGAHDIAARDNLTLPDFVTPLEKPPSLTGFFNQMKQEFVSARWLYYESISANDAPHFSDRDVRLFNTLDYPSYGLNVEKLKIAIRMAYSLFDKIAFFLNDYMKLNMKPRRVSFRSIWRDGDGRNAPVREEFERSENWPLRGLYWLSKDLLDETFQETPEPDARELYEIRNHLEHKYLKVHEMLLPTPEDGETAFAWRYDDLAFSITRSELSAKGLRVLKLSRAALVYLSLGMHREEKRRAETSKSGLILPTHLDEWDDQWKV